MGLLGSREYGKGVREGPVDDTERKTFEQDWAALSEDVLSGMADWRAQHPQATLREIELELDRRLARMHARMRERVAQQSAATTGRQPARDQAAARP
jgi:hypothetical protein